MLYQWNPLNIYGMRVDVEEIICQPLLPCETLMEDGQGSCRRIKVPVGESTALDRMKFWLQMHLNKNGHLVAIDNLITSFYQKLINEPPEETEDLQEFNLQIDRLRSLKNDYQFLYYEGNSSFIEARLKVIEEQAYSMFAYFYRQKVNEQEEERKHAFTQFVDHLQEKLEELNYEYCLGLIEARFIERAPTNDVDNIFKERVGSLDRRLEHVEALQGRINEIESNYEGKFTIPCLSDKLNRMRLQVESELHKLGIELELLIKNLVHHYHLSPQKEEIKALLDLMEINPEEILEENETPTLFHEAIVNEIKRIKRQFGN